MKSDSVGYTCSEFLAEFPQNPPPQSSPSPTFRSYLFQTQKPQHFQKQPIIPPPKKNQIQTLLTTPEISNQTGQTPYKNERKVTFYATLPAIPSPPKKKKIK